MAERNSRHRPPGTLRWTLGTAAALLLTFLGWANWAVTEEVVRGDGRTVPSGHNRPVRYVEGGVISRVLVEEGQTVRKGQALFEVRSEDGLSALRRVHAAMTGLYAKRLRLMAERAGRETLIFPAVFQRKAPQIVQAETALFAERQRQRRQALDVAREQHVQEEIDVSDLEEQARNLTEELQTAQKELAIAQKLANEDTTTPSTVMEKEDKVSDVVTRLGTLRQRIPAARMDRLKAERRIADVQAAQHAEIEQDYKKAEAQIRRLQKRLKADGGSVARNEIAAPSSGVVNHLYVTASGTAVQPGETVAGITPLEDNLFIESRIDIRDRPRIRAGQAVAVKVLSDGGIPAVAVRGHILHISGDSFLDKSRGRFFHRVSIRMDGGQPGGRRILPGMPADVHVLTGRKSMLQSLLAPLGYSSRS